MADCRKCKHNYKPSTCEPKCNRMCDGESDFEPMTNADRIRSMSDSEMARDLLPMIEEVCEDGVPCEEWFLEWLQSEVKDGE